MAVVTVMATAAGLVVPSGSIREAQGESPWSGALSVDARNGLTEGDADDAGDIKTILDMNCDTYGRIIDDSDDLSSSTTSHEESAEEADDAEFE
jgi:hypothetical protein